MTLSLSVRTNIMMSALILSLYMSLTNCVTVSGAICRQIRGWACRSSTCIIVQIPAHFVRQHRFSLIKISVKRPPPSISYTSGDLYEKCNVLRGKACACLCLPSWFLPHLVAGKKVRLGNYIQYKTCQGAWEFTHFTSVWMPLTYVLYFDLLSYKNALASHTYSTIYYLPN